MIPRASAAVAATGVWEAVMAVEVCEALGSLELAGVIREQGRRKEAVPGSGRWGRVLRVDV